MKTVESIEILAETFVSQHFKEKVSKEYAYHDFAHTQDVVRVCLQIAKTYSLPQTEIEILTLAAWFHDSGYDKGADNHEERSADYATRFLKGCDYPLDNIARVAACILATKMPHEPDDLLEKIICDADLSHLGEKTYWLCTARLRQELSMTQGRVMTEEEWLNFELNFLLSHQYQTSVAKELFEERKVKHIMKLRKYKTRLNPNHTLTNEDMVLLDKDEKEKAKWKALAKQSKQELKNYNLGRGVETMYRTTYNTHNNLSALADHKANLMLSINTIMISITLSLLVPQLKASPQLTLPTVMLLVVCLTSIVYATLSTRPKVTKGEVTLDDIRNKRSNLLFFGNFYNMKLEDFQWGMMEMIKDADFQYSSMTRDLYFLGKVLAKKYRYLTICYNVFMFGLIFVVLLFAFAFAFM
ncbi:MAG: HD family phosphohydrolase [Saprospiraceae bacterium]|nr:HD family phosphohydrolase [Saprospiraceae bacterium]